MQFALNILLFAFIIALFALSISLVFLQFEWNECRASVYPAAPLCWCDCGSGPARAALWIQNTWTRTEKWTGLPWEPGPAWLCRWRRGQRSVPDSHSWRGADGPGSCRSDRCCSWTWSTAAGGRRGGWSLAWWRLPDINTLYVTTS